MATINTDISQKVDIIIKAEDSLSLVLNITDSSGTAFDLTEYYVFFDIYGVNSDDTIIAAHNITAANTATTGSLLKKDYFNVLDNYTTPEDESDKITVTGVDGKIELNLSSDETSLTPGSYRYKMKLLKGTTIKTWMHGRFKVNE